MISCEPSCVPIVIDIENFTDVQLWRHYAEKRQRKQTKTGNQTTQRFSMPHRRASPDCRVL